jgi:hypothetical protein
VPAWFISLDNFDDPFSRTASIIGGFAAGSVTEPALLAFSYLFSSNIIIP